MEEAAEGLREQVGAPQLHLVTVLPQRRQLAARRRRRPLRRRRRRPLRRRRRALRRRLRRGSALGALRDERKHPRRQPRWPAARRRRVGRRRSGLAEEGRGHEGGVRRERVLAQAADQEEEGGGGLREQRGGAQRAAEEARAQPLEGERDPARLLLQHLEEARGWRRYDPGRCRREHWVQEARRG